MSLKIKVSKCINSCVFYKRSSDGMECGHPYFNDKGPYENMIISQNDRDGIPSKCPLRQGSCKIEYEVVLKGE